MNTMMQTNNRGDRRGIVWARRSPSDTMRLPAAIIGWLLRVALVCLGAYAFMLFLGDAGGLLVLSGYRANDSAAASIGAIFWTALAASWYAGCLFASRWSAVFTLLLSGGAGVWLYAAHGMELSRLLPQSFRCVWNAVLCHLVEWGYSVFSGFLLDDTYAYDPAFLASFGLSVCTAILALVLGALVLRRVHPIMLTLLACAMLIPVFVYNIISDNTGVLAVIAFVCGALALHLYDIRFGETARKRRIRKEKRQARRIRTAERRSARMAASDAMIAAYDAGGDRRAAKVARAEAYRHALALSQQGDVSSSARESADGKKLHLARFCNMAAGGFSGGGAAVLALLTLALPNALVDDNFPIIESLDGTLRIARMYTTAMLMGDDIDLNSLSVYGNMSDLNPRSVTFDSPMFQGEKIFSVECGYDAPVYLRGWIGMDYDLATDSWTSADTEAVSAYRETFGTDFSSDTVGYRFKQYVYPLTAELNRFDMYRGYADFGFVLAQTNVRRVGGSSRLLFLPTFFHTGKGVMEYGSCDANQYAVSSYFDGVYSSRFFAIPGRSYSAYSFITVMKNRTLGAVFEAQTAYYLRSLDYADMVEALETAHREGVGICIPAEGIVLFALDMESSYALLLSIYETEMRELGASMRGDSVLQQYIDMTDEERAEYRASYAQENAYRDYVYEQYTASFGSSAIARLADELLAESGWRLDETLLETGDDFAASASCSGQPGDLADHLVDADGKHVTRHDLVLMVLRYLREGGFQYTLTPEASETSQYASTLESFLFETKQGYCVHFATAAAAILREYGMAVRYSEGYLATNLHVHASADAVARYAADVYDYNAHAWIEVYYPLMGWVQYEATPAYMDAVYDEATYTPSEPSTSFRPPSVIEESNDEENPIVEEETEETSWTLWIVLPVTLCLMVLVFRLAMLRAQRLAKRRQDLIREAKGEEVSSGGTHDSRTLARLLNDAIFAVLDAAGITHIPGELFADYAERVATGCGEIPHDRTTDILAIMQKAEFGGALSEGESRALAEYLEELSTAVYRGLSRPRRFWLRWIRCIL